MNVFFDISNIDFLENLILKEIPMENFLTIIVFVTYLGYLRKCSEQQISWKCSFDMKKKSYPRNFARRVLDLRIIYMYLFNVHVF